MSRMLGKTKTRHCHNGPTVGGLLLPDRKERRANRAIETEQVRGEIEEQRSEEQS